MRKYKLLTLVFTALLAGMIIGGNVAQGAEFLILPANLKFSFKSEEGNTRLETLSGKNLECKSSTGSGDFESERLGNIEFKFTGCEFAGLACTGLGDTTGKITFSEPFHIRHLLGANNKPLKQAIMVVLVNNVHFTCGGIFLFLVTGCVASDEILDKKGGESIINKLVSTAWLEFLIKTRGDSIYSESKIDTDNSLGMETCVLLVKEGDAAFESSAQSGKVQLEKFSGLALLDLKGEF